MGLLGCDVPVVHIKENLPKKKRVGESYSKQNEETEKALGSANPYVLRKNNNFITKMYSSMGGYVCLYNTKDGGLLNYIEMRKV